MLIGVADHHGIMRREQEGSGEAVAHAFHQIENPLAGFGIEIGRRLIGQNKIGSDGHDLLRVGDCRRRPGRAASFRHGCRFQDFTEYGGSGMGNAGGVTAGPLASHGQPHALSITLPPLAIVYLRG